MYGFNITNERLKALKIDTLECKCERCENEERFMFLSFSSKEEVDKFRMGYENVSAKWILKSLSCPINAGDNWDFRLKHIQNKNKNYPHPNTVTQYLSKIQEVVGQGEIYDFDLNYQYKTIFISILFYSFSAMRFEVDVFRFGTDINDIVLYKTFGSPYTDTQEDYESVIDLFKTKVKEVRDWLNL